MNRRSVLFILGSSLALLTGCMEMSKSFRYRMRVEGRVNGEAVYELLATKIVGLRLADETPGGSAIVGDALVLETPSGPVFVLMGFLNSADNLKSAVYTALAPEIASSEKPHSYAVAHRLAGVGEGEAKGELPRKDWPIMVRFRDLRDPLSVEQVDPDEIGISRITVETTTDPVTSGIQQRLPWLSNDPLSYGGGGKTGEPWPMIGNEHIRNSGFFRTTRR